jgi:hypothetical protein
MTGRATPPVPSGSGLVVRALRALLRWLRNAVILGLPLACAWAAARWLPVSTALDPVPRHIYWIAVCGVNWLVLLPITGSIVQATAGTPLRRLLGLLLLGLVAGGAFLFQYLGMAAALRAAGPLPPISAVGEFAIPAGIAAVAAQFLLLARLFRPPVPIPTVVPEELRVPLRLRPAPPGHNAPEAATGNPLAELLAESAPLAVRARRRTIRLIWSDGETPVRMRFAEALPQLRLLAGARVHRNWWVHREGVAGIRRRGRRIRLVLYDGREVPVGGIYEPQLVVQGWLPARDVPDA